MDYQLPSYFSVIELLKKLLSMQCFQYGRIAGWQIETPADLFQHKHAHSWHTVKLGRQDGKWMLKSPSGNSDLLIWLRISANRVRFSMISINGRNYKENLLNKCCFNLKMNLPAIISLMLSIRKFFPYKVIFTLFLLFIYFLS